MGEWRAEGQERRVEINTVGREPEGRETNTERREGERERHTGTEAQRRSGRGRGKSYQGGIDIVEECTNKGRAVKAHRCYILTNIRHIRRPIVPGGGVKQFLRRAFYLHLAAHISWAERRATATAHMLVTK